MDTIVNHKTGLDDGILKDDGNSFRYIPIIEFVKDVFLLVDLDLEDKQLLKMLPSDHESFYGWNDNNKETISSCIIEKVQDKELLNKTVISNIKNGNLAVMVLCSHFAICHKLKYKDSLPFLYQSIISHPLLSDHNRMKLTDFYLDLGGEITDFTSYLTVPVVETEEATYSSWQWYLIEKLQYIESEKVINILLKILSSDHPAPNKLKAAEHLIQLSRIEGLEYWAAYVKENRVLPFEHKWANLQQFIANFPQDKAIDIFFSVLEFTYQNNLQDNFSGYYSIEESLYSSLITLAKKEHKHYTIIKNKLTDLINNFCSQPAIDSIKFYSERFTQRYYESQTQEVDVQTANLIYQESFS